MALTAPRAVAGNAGEDLAVLSPGLVGTIVSNLPVNVVLVGYESGSGSGQVDAGRLAAGLSDSTVAVVRTPLSFGVVRSAHVAFQLEYRTQFAPAPFTDAFFKHLSQVGTPRSPTDAQVAYNREPARRLTIEDPISLDAEDAERWLADHAGTIGVDPSQPTIFLVNWFGRDDFRFHVYVAPSTPDPDTGLDPADVDTRALVAWGGTAFDDPFGGSGSRRRVWFFDLSAGPDDRTRGFDLSHPDLDGDGYPDYRLPPIWEYGSAAGYRPFTDLSGDLGKVVRYVGVDELFAPSPLYNPAISPPLLPGSISVDVGRESSPGLVPSSFDTARVSQQLSRLAPWLSVTTTLTDREYSGRLAEVIGCWTTAFSNPPGDSCYGRRGGGYAYYDLFFWVHDHLASLTQGTADHHVPVLLLDVPDSVPAPLAGLSDGNPYEREYTQYHAVVYSTPAIRAAMYGSTLTVTHEVGHHLGLSHPHDGLDSSSGVSFTPTGDYYFTWLGDESATVMGYLLLRSGFGQLDQDALARWMTAAYLNEANQVLLSIEQSVRGPQTRSQVVTADQDALQALISYQDADYQRSVQLAQRAYEAVVGAAQSIHVPVEPEAGPADARSRSLQDFFVDPVPPEYVAPPAVPAVAVRSFDALASSPSQGTALVPTP